MKGTKYKQYIIDDPYGDEKQITYFVVSFLASHFLLYQPNCTAIRLLTAYKLTVYILGDIQIR